MKLNGYLPFAFIYFFLNSLGLPFGLTYTALLAPLFYIWILRKRQTEVLLPFLAMLTPFVLIHFLTVNPDQKAYLVSLLNIVLVYIFGQAVYTFLKYCDDPGKIFKWLFWVNFSLCLVAIVIYFTPVYKILWIEQPFTKGIEDFSRLKLFTYEASYYATLFTPLFFFFFLQYLLKQNTIPGFFLLVMLLLPYLLSFSFGVISCVLIAIFLTYIIHIRSLTKKRRVFNFLVYSVLGVGLAAAMVFLFFPDNPVFLRLQNVFQGEDLSGKGRTEDAFILADKILDHTNKYWGAGIGQIKVAGSNIIQEYYLYDPTYAISIPNAMAETLAIFGWIGFFLRMFIELFFFIYTRVWNNYYRLLLFFFIFFYQFTGSFITNVAEYVIWIIAFTPAFFQFNVLAASGKKVFGQCGELNLQS